MADSSHPQASELDELMRNAELRDEPEPYYDESISRVSIQQLPLTVENEYLASMLAWEVAPVLPIYRWFDPEPAAAAAGRAERSRPARHPLGHRPAALREADRARFHRTPLRPAALHARLPPHRSAEEEAVGAGVVRFAMFVTATVTDGQDLALAASVVDSLGTSARIRLRRAVGAQAATFAASLPLGLVTSAHLRVPQAMREAM